MSELVEKITGSRNWKLKRCEKDEPKSEKIEESQGSKKVSQEIGTKK